MRVENSTFLRHLVAIIIVEKQVQVAEGIIHACKNLVYTVRWKVLPNE
jgi:hypothetical protein